MSTEGQDQRKPTFVGQVIPDLDEDSDDPRAGGYWFIEFKDGKSAEILASEVGHEATAIELAWQRRR